MLTTIMLAEVMEQDRHRTRHSADIPNRPPPPAVVRTAVGRSLEVIGRRLQGGSTVTATPC